jgi:hypothetical protein
MVRTPEDVSLKDHRQLVAGIDQVLAKHVAHLFVRDPLVVFSETINQDDTSSNDHFEVCTHLCPTP